MTPEEKLLLINVDKRLSELIDIFYRINNIDKFVLNKTLVMRDTSIKFEGMRGGSLGGATTDRLAFYGKTPIVQQAAITAPTGGATVDSQARTAINTIILRLQTIGITA